MKTCIFCAQQIQEDSVFCHYCGRSQLSKKPISQPWTFGRVIMFIAAIILCLTGWAAIGGAIGYFTKPQDRIKGMFTGALIGCIVTILVTAVLLILGPVIGNVFSSYNDRSISQPPVIRTQKTPTSGIPQSSSNRETCYSWNQITLAMEGKVVCVEGTVAQVYSHGGASTRINFSTMPNTFFLVSAEYEFYYLENGTEHELTVGDCVQATEKVKVFDDGRHQIPYMQLSDLYRCEP